MVSETRHRVTRGLVLGCGGTLGAAWSIASLFEVSRALDWDPRTAEVIVGTSAGSELATLIGSGLGAEELLDAELGAKSADPFLARYFATPPRAFPPLPRARLGSPGLFFARTVSPLTACLGLLPIGRDDPSFLDALVDARVRGDWVPHRATRIVAVDFDTGARVAFGSKNAPPATMREAVRASWAIPGWFPPVSIGGRRYVDGGIVSPASADLLVGERLDEAIVIAPMASTDQGPRTGLGRIEGAVREHMRRTLDREIQRLREAGTRVLRIEPTAEDLAVMGPNFMDGSRRLRVLESSLRTTRRNVRAALARDGFATKGQVTEGAARWQA
ncbi:MAG: patatin-like phospholipase family protein [Polyangiales bacterium]